MPNLSSVARALAVFAAGVPAAAVGYGVWGATGGNQLPTVAAMLAVLIPALWFGTRPSLRELCGVFAGAPGSLIRSWLTIAAFLSAALTTILGLAIRNNTDNFTIAFEAMAVVLLPAAWAFATLSPMLAHFQLKVDRRAFILNAWLSAINAVLQPALIASNIRLSQSEPDVLVTVLPFFEFALMFYMSAIALVSWRCSRTDRTTH